MIHFYYGTDGYRVLGAIAQVMSPHQTAHADVYHLDLADEKHLEALERLLKYAPLLPQMRVISVQHIVANAQVAQDALYLLEQYGIASSTDVVLIASHVGLGLDRSKAAKDLVAFLKKHATDTREFTPQTGAQLASWVDEYCKERGRTIVPAARAMLIARAGHDSGLLANELEKLCAYSQETISLAAVELLTSTRREESEFALSNALAAKDKRGALRELWYQLAQGTAEQLLLGSVASSLRTLMVVGDLQSRGLTSGAIAQASGLHPYVVQKTMPGARAYDARSLAQAHLQIAQLDRQSKDGQRDTSDALFALIMAL